MGKVLLLTASFGEGHNQAAYAVQDALNQIGVVTEVHDYVDWLPKPIQRLSKFALHQMVKSSPKLYGFWYRSTARIKPSSSLQKQLNRLGQTELQQVLDAFQPNMVVSTFPMPNALLSELKSEGRTQVSTGCIVTDYTLHRQWVHEHTDIYFVAADVVKQQLMNFGVPADKICVTGIPIRRSFQSDELLRESRMTGQVRIKYGLSQTEPVVLIMGGGDGILEDVDAWEQLFMETPAQFVVVCGRNRSLYRHLKPLESNRIRIVGYTQNVHVLMSVADLLITKAGGITLSEAFAMELPMLLLPSIPGQEAGNGHFAVKSGAARQAESMSDVANILEHLVRTPNELQTMRRSASLHAKRNSSNQIADEIVKQMGPHNKSVRNLALS